MYKVLIFSAFAHLCVALPLETKTTETVKPNVVPIEKEDIEIKPDGTYHFR